MSEGLRNSDLAKQVRSLSMPAGNFTAYIGGQEIIYLALPGIAFMIAMT
jgi:hypothetical protein